MLLECRSILGKQISLQAVDVDLSSQELGSIFEMFGLVPLIGYVGSLMGFLGDSSYRGEPGEP